jgi:hypothetical protein
MHSPKVPHLDFSVQVVRHNLKIFCCGKLLIRERLRDWEKNWGQFRLCPYPHIPPYPPKTDKNPNEN